jgi:hypothetical protein
MILLECHESPAQTWQVPFWARPSQRRCKTYSLCLLRGLWLSLTYRQREDNGFPTYHHRGCHTVGKAAPKSCMLVGDRELWHMSLPLIHPTYMSWNSMWCGGYLFSVGSGVKESKLGCVIQVIQDVSNMNLQGGQVSMLDGWEVRLDVIISSYHSCFILNSSQ